MNSKKVNLVLKNKVGKVYNDKVVFGRDKFFIDELISIYVVKKNSHKYNYASLFLAIICFVVSYIFYHNSVLFLSSLIFGAVFLSIYRFFINEIYFIEIVRSRPFEMVKIRVLKKDKELAKIIVKVVTKIKNDYIDSVKK